MSSHRPTMSFFDRLQAELPRLFRTARRLTRSQADAEDLVQATVVRAIERRDDVRDLERLRGWLLQVQRTVLLNGARGARHRLEVVDGGRAEVAVEPSVDVESEILARSFDDRLDAALRALPDGWRDALLLREVEELSYDEIAAIQGCPVGTIRSRLARARHALFEALSQEEERRWQAANGDGSTRSRRGTTAK